MTANKFTFRQICVSLTAAIITAVFSFSLAALPAFADESQDHEDGSPGQFEELSLYYKDPQGYLKDSTVSQLDDAVREDSAPSVMRSLSKNLLMSLEPSANTAVMTNEKKQELLDACYQATKDGLIVFDVSDLNITRPAGMSDSTWKGALRIEVRSTLNELVNGSYPEAFYVHSYDIGTYNGLLTTITFGSCYSTSEIEQMREELEVALAEVSTWLDDSMTDLQKAKAIHDWLVRNVTYNTESAAASPSAPYDDPTQGAYYTPHTAYGALVDKHPVCDGYSLAVILVLNEFNVDSKMLVYIPASGTGHAWNVVKVDGEWYHMDVTWDDNSTESVYDQISFDTRPLDVYFLRSSAWWQDTSNPYYGPYHSTWKDEGVYMTSTKYDSAKPLQYNHHQTDNYDVFQAPYSENRITFFKVNDITARRGGTTPITFESLSPEDASLYNIQWTSTNTGVAAITNGSGGVPSVRGISEGTTTITGTAYSTDEFVPDKLIAKATVTISGVEPAHVVFYPNTESSDKVDVEVEPGNSTTALPAGTFSKQGHHFVKWNTNPNGSGTSYDPGDTISVPASTAPGKVIKVYAIWEANTYDYEFVDYDGTHISGGSATYSSLATAPTDPERAGYTFAGWDPDDLTVLDDQTFTATYTPNSYTVAYASGGKDVEIPGDVSTSYDQNIVLAEAYPDGTVTGYNFVGWIWTHDGEESVLDGGATVSNLTSENNATVTLAAKWEPVESSVSFDADGGTISVTEKNAVYGSAYGELPEVSKTGYVFDGWHNSSGELVTSETIVEEIQNHELTAYWKPANNTAYKVKHFKQNTSLNGYDLESTENKTGTTDANAIAEPQEYSGFHVNDTVEGTKLSGSISPNGDLVLAIYYDRDTSTVKYSGSDAAGAMSDDQLVYGVKTTLASNGFSKFGYHFAGWNDGSRSYEDQADMSAYIENGKTFQMTALWEGDPYTLKFNSNGGSGEMGDQDLVYGAPATIAKNLFSKTGYHFAGWIVGSAEGEVSFADEASTESFDPADSPITLYAGWIPSSYSVKFDANGGGGEMTPQQMIYGTETQLNPNTFSKTGHHFSGWKDESGNPYADQQSVSNLTSEDNGEVVLYAQWEKDIYQVRFEDYDGTLIGSVQQVPYLESAIPPDDPSRTGYTFAGWDGVYENVDGNRTIKATYTANIYTVTFANGGGSGEMTPQQMTYGVETALNENAFEKTGHDFAGWKDLSNGNTYTDKQSVLNMTGQQNGNVTLTAQWAKKKYNVRFLDNDGISVIKDTQQVAYQESAIPPETNLEKEHFQFNGWDKPYDSITEDIDILATYRADSFTVKYNVNLTGASEIADQVVEYGSGAVYATPVEPDGYTFLYWSREGSDEELLAGAEIEIEADDGDEVALTGHWTTRAYTVQFDANGGECSPASKQVAFNGNYGSLPTPTRTGYSFGGWWSEREGGSPITSASTLDDPGDSTIYAHWTINPHSVIIQKDEHITAVSGDGTFDYGSEITLSAMPDAGYHFSEWQVVSGLTSLDGNSFNLPDNDVIVKAVSAPNTYTVVFEANHGTGSMDPQSMTYDVSANLNECGFERAGYSFEKWTVSTGSEYADGEAVSNLTSVDGGVVTLTAQWTANTDTHYKVEHYKQKVSLDGYELVDTDNENGTTDTVATSTPKEYSGFSLNTAMGDYSSAVNIDGDGEACVKLYYDRNALQATFAANGGNGSMPSQTFVYGVSSTLPASAFSKTGYVLDGWQTAYGAYDDKASIEDLLVAGYASATFTAQWKANSFTVKFNANGGSGSMSDEPFSYGESKALTACAFTKTGYSFGGWSLASGGQATIPNEADGCTLTSDDNDVVNLYATWVPVTYTVSFDPGSGSGSMTPQTLAYDMSSNLKSCTFNKDGHDFAGWKDAANHTYEDMESVINLASTQDADVVLTAQWTIRKYTVTIDDTINAPTQQTVEHGGNAILPENPQKTGYTFKQWDKSNENITEDTIITALFDPITYTVEFKSNADDIADLPSVTMTYDAETAIPGYANNVREGFQFTKWTTNQNGSGDAVAIGSIGHLSTTNGDTVTLWAQWSKNTYPVTFYNRDGGVAATANVEHGSSAIPPSLPAVQGYTLTGWTPDLDNVTGSREFHPVYEPIGYKVKFNANGSTDETPVDMNRTYDDRIALPSMIRDGYDFIGWNTLPTGNGTSYNSGSTQNLSSTNGAEVTLHAQWRIRVYTVTFKDKNGTVLKTQTVEHGSSASAPLPTAFDGYTFNGWDKQFASITDHTTVTALYSPNRYTVAYRPNCDASLATIPAQSMTYDSETAISAGWENDSRVGYKFKEWNTQQDGGGTTYAGGYLGHLTKENGVTVTLWAQWERLSVHSSITYSNLAKSAVAIDMSSFPDIVYGDTVILPTLSNGALNEPFLGWSIDGGKTVSAPGTPLDLGSSDSEPVITAVWGPVPYEILKGKDAQWQKGSNEEVELSSNADFDKFEHVNMDGSEIPASCYLAKKGSTVIVFKPEYLETLSVGEHDVEIVSSDGSAHATLSIIAVEEVKSDEKAELSDQGNMSDNSSADDEDITGSSKKTSSETISGTGDVILYSVLAILALGVIGIFTTLIIRKRRK